MMTYEGNLHPRKDENGSIVPDGISAQLISDLTKYFKMT